MHHSTLVTFIIPTYGRPELLRKCLSSINFALASLRPQDLKDFKFKTVIVFNGELPVSLTDFPDNLEIESLTIDKSTPSEARNIAAKKNPSDYYYFIDDDTTLPDQFLNQVCQIINANPNIAVFGGPDKCGKEAKLFEMCLELALRSPLTTSKTRKRHTPTTGVDSLEGLETNLILCNLCVKSDVFHKHGYFFPEDYFRNEENVFLAKIHTKVSVLYFPHHYIYHQRRPEIKNVFRAASRSGFYRYQMMCDGYNSGQLLFLAPSLFVIYLSLLIFLDPSLQSLFYIPLYTYFFLNILTSIIVSKENHQYLYFPIISGYQLLIKMSYGIGMIVGIASRLKTRKPKMKLTSV